ncbi:xanthine dehydrogenase family protein molybdopterin-binding subunit [Achromobacter sp. GG226]|uniref:xanthine dehydrogenase family protein molybdopterin-binding subunit n=1 Tax=Verticiella alkaliphila TaxID=2779529 RepID=UPI001C0C770A|nr:xanthine dehydrogenase family protein molybdopterin-binding subunit [Verticiella sp. GG226]MBU4611717.1 xanthine dehydrogenase family protein molybdopterin-binding subunit [Verticiella sp. GG226]
MTQAHPNVLDKGIGARLSRKEDARFLTGRGQYVGDLRMPDMLDVAFVRSPLAHARIQGVDKPEGLEHLVFTWQDLAGVKPILAASGLPGFRTSLQYPLAHDKVRFVGEMVAMCVAPTRAQAEDIADQVLVDYAELPVVADMRMALDDASPTRLHEAWDANVFLETQVQRGEPVAASDGVRVSRQLSTSRQCMMPLEGRGVLCWWDSRLDQLVMTSAAQLPHINRTGLAECLGLDEGQIRVVSPDVGGGFGYKGLLLPEEICCAWLAMHLGRPIRWLEDRREHLGANANCREHAYDITVQVSAEGVLTGIECDAVVDSGAYSSYPFSACLEAAQVGSILPGPYRMAHFQCRTRSAATNKPPILPYRGVARTGVCFALEVMLDFAARELGIEPYELRERSLVRREDMPFTNITGKTFDSGDYALAMRRAVETLGWRGWRERQHAHQGGGAVPQRRIGLGLAVFCEQGAHGTSVYHGWGIPMVPGYEQCHVRMTADGVLEVQVGIHSHGQGLETTLAQVAHSVLSIDPARVRVLHGDTATSPYSTGTWGSRCAVMAGGAVGTACEALGARLRTIAAGLLQVDAESLVFADGGVQVPGGAALSLNEIAHTWYRAPQRLPAGVDPGGLALTAGYRMQPDGGTFSYACHACAVEVDTATGLVRLLDYAVCEDGGVLLNPMIVEGQLLGGLAQGIGTALYEEMPFDAEGQPLASTLADYMIPGAGEMPTVRLDHLETPSPFSKFGQKGIGEGGAIAPPAAIVNAINDALAGIGAQLLSVPASPARVLTAIREARA